MLSKELDIVLQLQELDAYPEGLCVEVSLCAEKESLRPQSVYYDFSELTPYVGLLIFITATKNAHGRAPCANFFSGCETFCASHPLYGQVCSKEKNFS